MYEKTIYRCVATNNGRISISGSNQYGRPMSFVTKSNIPKTRDCLRSDGGLSVKEIARFVHCIYRISTGSVFAKAGDIKTHSSVCPSVRPSVCHKNFNLTHIFWSINDRALIFGMHDPCVKPFQLTPCRDLDLWPSNLVRKICNWIGELSNSNIFPYCRRVGR